MVLAFVIALALVGFSPSASSGTGDGSAKGMIVGPDLGTGGPTACHELGTDTYCIGTFHTIDVSPKAVDGPYAVLIEMEWSPVVTLNTFSWRVDDGPWTQESWLNAGTELGEFLCAESFQLRGDLGATDYEVNWSYVPAEDCSNDDGHVSAHGMLFGPHPGPQSSELCHDLGSEDDYCASTTRSIDVAPKSVEGAYVVKIEMQWAWVLWPNSFSWRVDDGPWTQETGSNTWTELGEFTCAQEFELTGDLGITDYKVKWSYEETEEPCPVAEEKESESVHGMLVGPDMGTGGPTCHGLSSSGDTYCIGTSRIIDVRPEDADGPYTVCIDMHWAQVGPLSSFRWRVDDGPWTIETGSQSMTHLGDFPDAERFEIQGGLGATDYTVKWWHCPSEGGLDSS